ncbi:MAG: hypothetical protein IT244_12860 [Bacteroidia bacterium]|nr:hypothetical protein [Bacteroidia bacterium]
MKKILFSLAIIASTVFAVTACFWDKDTLEMEKQKFPEVADLISGNFLRHSSAFHNWRIKDREKKIQLYPDSISLYDDLAVSYSKIGNNKKAIEVILKKDKIKSGLYETYANLGTFYLHDGKYKEGIVYIDKAISINPNAHFGREIYQKYAAEYILSKLHNNKLSFPLYTRDISRVNVPTMKKANFFWFIIAKLNIPEMGNYKYKKQIQSETQKAIKGISGMMKFGNYDSPILLELLGDLLMNTEDYEADRQLAAMAYLKASYAVSDSIAAKKYRNKIFRILEVQEKIGDKIYGDDITGIITKVEVLENMLQKEILKGNALFSQIEKDETNWIAQNKDVEAEFNNKYYKNAINKTKPKTNTPHKSGNNIIYIIGASFLTLIVLIIAYFSIRKSNSKG